MKISFRRFYKFRNIGKQNKKPGKLQKKLVPVTFQSIRDLF